MAIDPQLDDQFNRGAPIKARTPPTLSRRLRVFFPSSSGELLINWTGVRSRLYTSTSRDGGMRQDPRHRAHPLLGPGDGSDRDGGGVDNGHVAVRFGGQLVLLPLHDRPLHDDGRRHQTGVRSRLRLRMR